MVKSIIFRHHITGHAQWNANAHTFLVLGVGYLGQVAIVVSLHLEVEHLLFDLVRLEN